MAIRTAPGVLAVKADYETGTATIGTRRGEAVAADEILTAVAAIGYRGEFGQRDE
jgi:hypothetical protein